MKTSRLLLSVLIFCLPGIAFLGTRKKIDRMAVIPKYDTMLIADIHSTGSFKNLTIFYLSGSQNLNDVEYVTLSEALEKGYVTLFETGSVNELVITNKSEHYVFIHAGDIVKGGKQDRTMGADIIVPPNEKDMPLASFCVEASRWSQRGNEKADKFSVNENMLPSRNMRVAAKQAQNQSMVWNTISTQQSKLSTNVSKMKGEEVDVRSGISETSLQLTLENEDLDSLRNVYKMHFEIPPHKGNTVIGFAYVINGELYGADVYNNEALFQDMWPKLLNSVIVEAIADFESDTIEYEAPDSIICQINQVYQGDTSLSKVNVITHLLSFETSTMISHETYDLAHNGWIHKSYIAIDTTQAINTYEIDFNRQDYRNNINPVQRMEIYDNPEEIQIEQIQQGQE